MNYGPGKFEACGNYSHIAQYIYDNVGHSIGDSESFGWYGQFNGQIKHVRVFAIVSEDSQGFVDVDYFDDEKSLNKAWDKLETEYAHACGPEIEYGDLKLDHIPDVAECRAILKRFKKQQFWPNVWHVNDHGNVDLLSIGNNGAKIVESWV